MQQKGLVLIGAGAFLLVLGATSYGADVPSEVTASPPPTETMPAGQVGDSKSAGTKGASSTATASDPPTLSDPQSIYLAKENPFFATHIEKAVKHAREAEIAGNLGQAPELQQHAQLSLAQAREAQRAGNVPGLNEGIASLREALMLREASSVQEATNDVREARKNFSQAGGIKFVNLQPQAALPTR